MPRRSEHGYTILEVMTAVSIMGVVIGMIYMYFNQGWKGYYKSLSYGIVETNTRSALEQMALNIKNSSQDFIFTDTGFNPRIPLPSDALIERPYIYFAKPNFKVSEAKASKSLVQELEDDKGKDPRTYNYYLYYFAAAKDPDRELSDQQIGKLKLLIIKDQSANYTESNVGRWPFLPPELLSETEGIEDSPKIKRSGLVSKIKTNDLSPEFSFYESKFSFDFNDADSEFKNLFSINVHMVDLATKTEVSFQTAVTPRN